MAINSLASSRSVFTRLGRLVLHSYKPPSLTPRYTQHIHTSVRGSRSEVLDSIRGFFCRHVKRVTAYQTTLLLQPAASSRTRLPTPSRRWYRDPRKVAATVLFPFAIAGTLCHHEIVPYTNRTHWVILSPSNERKLGNLIFNDIKKELSDNVLGSSDPKTTRVRLIASNIIRGVHHALLTKITSDDDVGMSSYNVESSVAGNMWATKSQKQGKVVAQPQTEHLRDLDWEVIVVKNDRFHAHSFGGKILVHTGCLNYFETDAEIATLIAHEVGHVVARHHTEFTKLIKLIPPLYRLMPFSRRKEMEADLIGMMLMAAAGYDPRVAPRVWQKLGEIHGNPAWKDYIGTHPTGKKRSRLLSESKAMEKALELYDKKVCAGESADQFFSYGVRF